MANTNTEIGFLAGATMNGTILLEGAGTGNRFIGMSAAGAVTIGATGVIRNETGFGGNTQIRIGNNFSSAMALTNGGLISSQVTGRTITINAASMSNSGTLSASNGGALLIPGGYVQSAGVTHLGGGTLAAQTLSANDTLQLNGGMLEGFGSIVANVSISGVIDPTVGAANGLAINDDLSLGTNAEFALRSAPPRRERNTTSSAKPERCRSRSTAHSNSRSRMASRRHSATPSRSSRPMRTSLVHSTTSCQERG